MRGARAVKTGEERNPPDFGRAKSKLPARLQDAIVVVRLVETLIDQGMRCDE